MFVYSSITSCCKDHSLCLEPLNDPIWNIISCDAATSPFINNKAGYEPFIIELYTLLKRLFIHSMQQVVACPIFCIHSPWKSCSSEGTLGDPAVICSRKKRSSVFHVNDTLWRILAKYLYGILVSEIINAFNGVKGMVFPSVISCQHSVYSTLGSN